MRIVAPWLDESGVGVGLWSAAGLIEFTDSEREGVREGGERALPIYCVVRLSESVGQWKSGRFLFR